VFSLSGRQLYVDALDLWVDSMRRQERCYVSHGHSDHAREHTTIVTTPNTARICRARFSRAAQQRVAYEEHAFDVPWSEREHTLTLFSAGHVLGSAQLLIEGERGRFVYTGDFKLRESLTVEPPEVKRCDVLLMECTFGRPQYVFPAHEEIAAEMVAFAQQTLGAGALPLFFAYSLGKAQEAMALLGRAGLPLTVHPAVANMAQVYETCGIALPPYAIYDSHFFTGESVLIWPPGGRALPRRVRNKHVRTAVLTGWSIDRNVGYRYGADRAFALSDHADYPALLEYIERAQPQKVLLNHGWRDFTYRLRALGIDAEYLEENAQLSLF
jgi:Cft2 family RNA processing exonuclease